MNQQGQGGMGTVFAVKLCENSSGRVKGLYACKIILKSFILSKNTDKRKLDLEREIKLLK